MKLSRELDYRIHYDVEHDLFHAQNIFSDEYITPTFIEYVQKLEREISVLLSCKNCPNNKGGYICEKEYEEKCLSQKIQYIKKLQEEIAELNGKLSNLSRVAEVRLANWQKYEKAYNETEELLDKQIEATYNVVEENKEAKEIMKNWLQWANDDIGSPKFQDIVNKTEQFLRCCEI